MNPKPLKTLTRTFKTPILIFLAIILSLLIQQTQPLDIGHLRVPRSLGEVGSLAISPIILLLATALGSFGLLQEMLESLSKKQFALDYIALLALITSIFSGEYLVAAVIALMISSGKTLESYGLSQAQKSLSLLVNRIPQTTLLVENGQPTTKEKINKIKIGQQIFIRKGEVIPLDGILISSEGYTDESSLTGEPYLMEKVQGDIIRSGTINTGQPIIIQVTKIEADSTYKKIIHMVQKAQQEKSPFIRLADQYSTIFTIITLIIAALAYLISPHLKSILSVLVIATPCPLIIATPIALLGGVNKAAKKRIIIKKLASLEALAKTKTFIFDKTGTITIGKPSLTHIEILNPNYSEEKILSIGQSLERNSLHPLAKTILEAARQKNIKSPTAADIEEKIGQGISGTIDGKRYTLSKKEDKDAKGMNIALLQDSKTIAILQFEDTIKKQSIQTITRLKTFNLEIYILTGDQQKIAEQIAEQLNIKPKNVLAGLLPDQKQNFIKNLKQKIPQTPTRERISHLPFAISHSPKNNIAFVGDGINDAPALALADVGLVFSNEEQTAASEAADIVLLGAEFPRIIDTYDIAKRTIQIATQSILWGIGLSILGMLLASAGLIPPLYGAALQELIDITVILNALRASK